MNLLRLQGFCLLALLSIHAELPAHGGTYYPPPPPPRPARPGGHYGGPGDTTPGGPSSRPTTGPAAPTSPTGPTAGPAGPATPGPSAPSTGGGPASPGPTGGPASPRGPATARGVVLEDDQTSWVIWWELNNAPFLRLKDAVHDGGAETGSDEFYLGMTRRVAHRDRLRPTARDVDDVVVPVLVEVLQADRSRDETTAAMVALAKAGREPGSVSRRKLFGDRLGEHDQEVRETAALCLGIGGLHAPAEVRLLLDLALDTPAGRRACGRAAVDERTRAFAIYGLGLLPPLLSAHERAQVATALSPLLSDAASSRNVKVAVGLALAQFAVGPAPAERMLAGDLVAALGTYWTTDRGAGEQLMQAHAVTGVASLLGATGMAVDAWRDRMVTLLGTATKRSDALHPVQSCALALPRLATDWRDDDAPAAAIGTSLLGAYRSHRDQQTRWFAALGLGFLGGSAARTALLGELDRADKAHETPWLALALGVLERRRQDAGDGPASAPDAAITEALRARWGEVKSPETRGALAVAFGLCRDRGAIQLLRTAAQDTGDDTAVGYACIGLAMIGDRDARDLVRGVVDRSARRPLLLARAAIALGLLGDKAVGDQLVGMLGADDAGVARLSAVARAIGLVGDRRSLPGLAAMARNADQTALARAFALAALGAVADSRSLPWNTPYALGVNYRAAVETLRDGMAGILDIL